MTTLSSEKDLVEGTQGLFKGWADEEKRMVLLEVKLMIDNKMQNIAHACTCRNIKLTSEYLLENAGAPEEEPPVTTESSSSPSDVSQSLLNVLGGEPNNLKIEKGWKDLLADADDLLKIMQVKGRIATGLKALQDLLPHYTCQDLLVVNRKNDRACGRLSCGQT